MCVYIYSPNSVYTGGVLADSLVAGWLRLRGCSPVRPQTFVRRHRKRWGSGRSRLREKLGRATFDRKTQWFWHNFPPRPLWPPGCLLGASGCLLGASGCLLGVSWVSPGCLQMPPDIYDYHIWCSCSRIKTCFLQKHSISDFHEMSRFWNGFGHNLALVS